MSHVAAKLISTTGAVSTGPTTLRGLVINTGASAGDSRITLTDGSGGSTLFDLIIPEGDTTIPIYLPEPGIRFQSGVYVSVLTDIDSVTFLLG